jgi:hypothetical protein
MGIIFPAAHEETFTADKRYEYLKTNMDLKATEFAYGDAHCVRTRLF